MTTARLSLLALGAAASLALVGCGNSTNIRLGVNEQLSYTAKVQGNATVRNTGYTPVTIVKRSADTEQVLTISLQPDNKQDHYLEPGSRITFISGYNLPSEFELSFTSSIASSFTKEGPGPAADQ